MSCSNCEDDDSTQPLESRRQIAETAMGIVTETAYRNNLPGTSSILTPGDAAFVSVGARKGDRINAIAFYVVTAATLPTLFKVALYDANGVLLGSSVNDIAAVGAANALVSVSLQAEVVIPSDGLYYAAILAVAAAGPGIVRQGTALGTVLNIAGPLPGGVRAWGAQTGQADLPNPIAHTPAAPANAWWLACQ